VERFIRLSWEEHSSFSGVNELVSAPVEIFFEIGGAAGGLREMQVNMPAL